MSGLKILTWDRDAVRGASASRGLTSELKFRRKLDGAQAADLVERIEAAVRAA